MLNVVLFVMLMLHVFLLARFRVCESEFVDLTPNKPEKVGDVPSAAAAVMSAGSRKAPYTIHVSFHKSRIFTLNLHCVSEKNM